MEQRGASFDVLGTLVGHRGSPGGRSRDFSGFAERLSRIGAEIDQEVRLIIESSVRTAQLEALALRDEVDRLQSRLEEEWRQNATRLGLCTELKQELLETREAHVQEVRKREHWQQECEAIEERHSLLEAKFVALELTEAETRARANLATDAPASALKSLADTHADVVQNKNEELKKLESGDSQAVSCYLDLLQRIITGQLPDGETSRDFEKPLHQLEPQGVHALLVAAAGRREDASSLVRHIIRLWVGQLVGWQGGRVLREAVSNDSPEVLETLLALGGTPGAVSAAGKQQTSADPCLLTLCVERGEVSLLRLLLEHSSSSSHFLLESARRAYTVALRRNREDLAAVLAGHLTVEMSLCGNSQYRQGEYEVAIQCYNEAIMYCEQMRERAEIETGEQEAGKGEGSKGSGENLVRLRYNLARAMHRSNRWEDARCQATAVLDMNPTYLNALALRAQSAMALYDWSAAQSDFEQLLRVARSPGACGQGFNQETFVAWRRKHEECVKHLTMTQYEILQLPDLSSIDLVDVAFQNLARQWHPDKHRHESKDYQVRAANMFNRLKEAFETLSDDSAKRAYDKTLVELDICSESLTSERMQGTARSDDDVKDSLADDHADDHDIEEADPEPAFLESQKRHSVPSPDVQVQDSQAAAPIRMQRHSFSAGLEAQYLDRSPIDTELQRALADLAVKFKRHVA